MATRSSGRRTSLGVLFWIACILLLLVVFLANRTNIQEVLESTGLIEVVRDRLSENRDAEPGPAVSVERELPEPQPAPQLTPAPQQTPTTQPTPSPAPSQPAPQPTVAPAPTGPAPAPAAPVASRPETVQRAPSPDPARPNRLSAALYFIKVTDEGRTYPQRVSRTVYYDSSPLTESIRALLTGPTSEELGNGLLNLIPEGSRLISAHVENKVAYLSFNSEFRFNALGAEGTVAQLLQVIYSSTEFPTVDRVQFLIEGERVDYLGGDGIYVGEPLGRGAFSL